MLNPPIKNIGLAGLKKWADTVPRWPGQFEGLNLFGCLLNTFIYIEIGGTGGSAFRPMYARFLTEAAPIVNEPRLKSAAKKFEHCAGAWSEIAAAALPDSYPALARIRALASEKNRLFEEQQPGALDRMRNINAEFDGLVKKAGEELEKRDISPLLSDLRQKILECREIEAEALETLSGTIA